MSPSSTDASLALPAHSFDSLFPFHLVIDEHLKLRQAGTVLRRHLPKRHLELQLGDLFSIVRPQLPALTLELIRTTKDKLWILQTASGLNLRGSWHFQSPYAFFICTAWISDIDALSKLKLKLADFPMYDSTTDHLMLIRQQQLGMEEMQALSQQLRTQKDRAETASSAKTAFLTNMSHEIRTPMNGIMGMTQILLDSVLSEAQQEVVATITASTDHLLAVINDILELAQYEAGKMLLDPEPAQPEQLIHRALDICHWSIQRNSMLLRVEVEDSQWVALDPVRITQVLVNLIGNAVKFSDSGSELTLRCRSQDSILRFEVQDAGQGMAHPESMFEPFARADEQIDKGIEGTGLGLAICKRIVEAHKGTIGALSKEHEGTTVWFELPLIAAAPPNVESVTRVSDGSLEGRVLLVEDNEVNQRVGRAHLESMGLQVTIANDGQQALDFAATETFNLILMDCQMPVLDGFEATRQLRQAGVDTPIIALTADVLSESHNACIAAGMNDVFTKPIQRQALATDLGHWLGSSRE